MRMSFAELFDVQYEQREQQISITWDPPGLVVCFGLHNIEKDPVSGQTLPAILGSTRIVTESIEWYFNNQLHNNDKDPISGLTLPAIIYRNYTDKFWYLHGKLHRTDKDPLTGQLLPDLICNDAYSP